MLCNVGNVDRVVRVVLGLGLLLLVFVGPETPWGYLGLLPLVTGLVGYSPLYHLFGRTPLKRRLDSAQPRS